jgi:CO dehydrogenase/acetyl-CoA synthase beta subunit
MIIHCDELIDDESQPACLRAFLEYNRRPAIDKNLPEAKEPKLFAILKADKHGQAYLGHWDDKGPVMQPMPMKAGQVVRVVMASRFGDVGITPVLKNAKGYVARVLVSDLDNFSDTSPMSSADRGSA